MQVDTLKEHVVFVLVVEPRLVDCSLSWVVIVQNWSICLLSEHSLSLHALNYFLCSVSVMDVKIYNRYFINFLSVCALQISSSDRHVVNVAESVGIFLVTGIVFKCRAKNASMMSWWPDRAKAVFVLVKHNFVAGFYDSSRGQERSIPRLWWQAWVPVIPLQIASIGVDSLTLSYNRWNIPIIVDLKNITYVGRYDVFLQLIPRISCKCAVLSKHSFILIHQHHQPLCIFRLMIFLLNSFLNISIVEESCMLQAVFVGNNKSFSHVFYTSTLYLWKGNPMFFRKTA